MKVLIVVIVMIAVANIVAALLHTDAWNVKAGVAIGVLGGSVLREWAFK